MVDSRASRPMEDFFLIPTVNLSHLTPDNMSLDCPSPLGQQRDYFTHHSTLAAPSKSTPSVADLNRKSTMWSNGYASDEEVASPIDDDMSIRSGSSVSIGSIISLHDQPSDSCNKIEQRCNHAQAVRIQTVGKPKVVELPKLDLSYRRRPVRPATVYVHRSSRPVSAKQRESSDDVGSSRSSHDSQDDASNVSSPRSPASTAPSSISEEQSPEQPPKLPKLQLKRNTTIGRRHVDLLEAARSPTSVPSSPMFPRSVDQFRRQSTALSDRWCAPSSPKSPALRKMNKLSSVFDFRTSKTSNPSSGDLESVKEPEPFYVAAQQTPQLRLPPRRTSLQPKLIARGANEREPPITLPPFPEAADKPKQLELSRADSTRSIKRRPLARGRSSSSAVPVAEDFTGLRI
ncbi:Hypothetical predicted protein [Lecanosticta acicola]|uniref:Uncharacterized protein n=1 Tax=Lecanosticta acicola TaxID=111012 RepID=A0AAI8YSS2_9PEZI|nr:Hypothetical predicted protein [Lecanosticta acicola]